MIESDLSPTHKRASGWRTARPPRSLRLVARGGAATVVLCLVASCSMTGLQARPFEVTWPTSSELTSILPASGAPWMVEHVRGVQRDEEMPKGWYITNRTKRPGSFAYFAASVRGDSAQGIDPQEAFRSPGDKVVVDTFLVQMRIWRFDRPSNAESYFVKQAPLVARARGYLPWGHVGPQGGPLWANRSLEVPGFETLRHATTTCLDPTSDTTTCDDLSGWFLTCAFVAEINLSAYLNPARYSGELLDELLGSLAQFVLEPMDDC